MYDPTYYRNQPRGGMPYVPGVEDIFLPPPPAYQGHWDHGQRQDRSNDGGLGFIAILASLLVTTIIIVAMLIDGQQAGKAILVGAGFFTALMVVLAFLFTGTLSAIVATVQHERTERLRIEAYADIAEQAIRWRMEVERPSRVQLDEGRQPPSRVDAGALQGPTGTGNFVPPVKEPTAAKLEALAWARALYRDDGYPNPRMVRPNGWVRVRMLGSKRDTGSADAGEWLIRNRVVKRANNGYVLNLVQYPTRESLKALE